MDKKTIQFIRIEDYEAVYINGVKVCDAHSIEPRDLLEALGYEIEDDIDVCVDFDEDEFPMENYWVNGYGFFDNWADIKFPPLD